jgi:hypothetical protein
VTDYKRDTGSSGEMMIRDTGTTVSFLINSHNSSTFVHEMPWGYTVNGATNNSREADYNAGAGWLTLGSWTVTTDQTVTFRLFDTGTSGLGGPTTLTAAIDRASAPNAPAIASLLQISSTQVNVKITDGANNGASITARQIAINTVNTTSSANLTSEFTATTFAVFPLNPGTLYYFWARTKNSKGYSAWSPVKSITTYRIPDTPNQPIVSDPSQTAVTISFTENGNGGSAILERQIGYYVEDRSDLAATVNYPGSVMTIDGLQPGVVHYFWARVRNSTGWSNWSPVATQKTIAGAWINVNGVWKDAIPFVNVGGVWKLARPWGRVAGVWKKST